jgi:hypothetical protein
VSNGIFGTVKTDEQLIREEKYKLDLKQQIDEKRQRKLDELARRRAEEEHEIAKHAEWQQRIEKQQIDEAARKQEQEEQERQQQQQLAMELERQREEEERLAKQRKLFAFEIDRRSCRWIHFRSSRITSKGDIVSRGCLTTGNHR